MAELDYRDKQACVKTRMDANSCYRYLVMILVFLTIFKTVPRQTSIQNQPHF